MKKYILAKDLPFAKAGELIYNYKGHIFDDSRGYDCFVKVNEGVIFPRGYLYSNNNMVYIGDKRNLISNWIKELKPREYYIGLTSKGIIPETVEVADNIEYFDELPTRPAQIIKVREVIE